MVAKARYDAEYFGVRHYETSIHNDRYYQHLLWYLPTLATDRVLDVGCANGLFLRHITNPESRGLDISEHILTEARENAPHIGFDLFDLEHGEPLPDGTFDVITCFDIIEHLTSFEGLGRLIDACLAPSGTFVVTTPNAISLLRFLSRERFTGEADPTHRVLFTPYTLDFFLRRLWLEKIRLFTPYSFYSHDNFLTGNILLGGQIFAIYRKNIK